MRIGIISDTHDNIPKIRAAVDLFNRAGVDAVLHCGDFVAPFALLSFTDLACKKFHAVFGNNDGEKTGILKLAAQKGWNIGPAGMDVAFSGKKIIMLHEPDRIDTALNSGCDIILYGHTHKPKAEHKNGCLLLNPGEGGGWLSGTATVAVLDLKTMAAEFHEVGGSPIRPM
ncbi:MAG: metallophosphoesterase [Nitrospinae bacterium]|nr:metallophosphoesterase [Nitrospinota bacterium]